MHIASPGARPADGLTGCRFFGGSGTERWGNYPDAVISPQDGTLWMATEWIEGNVAFPRLANWKTRMLEINP